VGVPPSFPPRKINGISVGCFLTPDTAREVFTHPASVSDDIRRLVGEYPADVKQFRTDRKDWLRDEIFAMSRTQFTVVRHLLERGDWDYFQFVDIGLDRIHHGFWQYHDSNHVLYEPDNPYRDVVADYYLHLDEQIGSVLELVDNETLVLLASDHGAQRLDGGFCVNEWLVQQGWLVLEEYPDGVTPFTQVRVDWSRTKAWSEGGYYARVFLNVEGREPAGAVPQSEYESFRDEVKAALEETRDSVGRPLGTRVFKPEAIYRSVRNVAPDLIAHFGDLRWRSIGGLGYRALHTLENDTGPDGCNHAQFGAMVLASPLGSVRGEITGAHLLDIAPTLLELAGYDVPSSMQGQSLAGKATNVQPLSADDEAVLRERLSGLGYIS
jgi:predicted AlkP superfamily phosphohydrolase/phosphomutase